MDAEVPTPQDFGKVSTALGLFACAIKSGEQWTDTCEQAQREAHKALVKIGAFVHARQIR